MISEEQVEALLEECAFMRKKLENANEAVRITGEILEAQSSLMAACNKNAGWWKNLYCALIVCYLGFAAADVFIDNNDDKIKVLENRIAMLEAKQ